MVQRISAINSKSYFNALKKKCFFSLQIVSDICIKGVSKANALFQRFKFLVDIFCNTCNITVIHLIVSRYI